MCLYQLTAWFNHVIIYPERQRHPTTGHQAGKDYSMKKLLAAILIVSAAFAAGHAATMATIDIQTDGDGDSAIVKTLGLEYFRGINGYTVD